MTALSTEQWERTGNHVERGRITVRELARHMAGHDINHLKQLERWIAIVNIRICNFSFIVLQIIWSNRRIMEMRIHLGEIAGFSGYGEGGKKGTPFLKNIGIKICR